MEVTSALEKLPDTVKFVVVILAKLVGVVFGVPVRLLVRVAQLLLKCVFEAEKYEEAQLSLEFVACSPDAFWPIKTSP